MLAGIGLGAPAVAAAADPPPNDAYLSSRSIEDPRTGAAPHNVEFADRVDTTAATVQTDLLSPPRSGGVPEPTVCSGTAFGNTVWYDINTDSAGTVQVIADGFDTVVAVYEFDPDTGDLLRSNGCLNGPGNSEDISFNVERGRSYSIQIGGVDAGLGPAFGSLGVTFRFYTDRDGDEILDGLDKCPSVAGVEREGGCPPDIVARPTYGYRDAPGGVILERFAVPVRGAARARVEVSCSRGCSFKVVKRSRGSAPVRFPSLAGRRVPAGALLRVRVTAPGRFGAYVSYRVGVGAVGPARTRCMLVGSTVPRRTCP